MDEEAARAAAALQQLTRLGFSVQRWSEAQQEAGQRQDGARGAGSGAADGRRRGGGSKCAAGDPGQRWQDHPIWGQLPLLSRLQQLAVGAELPGGGAADGEEGASPAGPGGAAVLPFDLLEGSVPDGIMDCRWVHGRSAARQQRAACPELHAACAGACTRLPACTGGPRLQLPPSAQFVRCTAGSPTRPTLAPRLPAAR